MLGYEGPGGVFAGVFASPLVDPTDMEIGPDGDLYVADGTLHTVLRFDGKTGNAKGYFVSPGAGGLVSPRGLTFSPNGDLYVSGTSGKTVMRYDGGTGAFVKQVLDGGNVIPGEITIGPDGFVYYYCITCKAVKKVDESLGEIVAILCKGVDGPQNGRGMAWGPDGNIYLTSGVNQDSVKKYDGVTGDFIGVFATGGMNEPWDVEFAGDGRMYVASGAGGNVMVFDAMTGVNLGEYAGSGEGGLTDPSSVAIGPVVCYADCEDDGDLDIFDFLCFQGRYATGDAYADCEKDGDTDLFDYLCFLNTYASGCP